MSSIVKLLYLSPRRPGVRKLRIAGVNHGHLDWEMLLKEEWHGYCDFLCTTKIFWHTTL
jgi:hypothetical protein